jgi:predicted dehydrogenase
MSVKTAIIGCGIMGRRMLEHMSKHKGYDPVEVWDPNLEACKEAQKIVSKTNIAQDAQAAIQAADLVYLACPPAPRKALALSAAAAGKSIFLEKPLGVNIEDSEELVQKLTSYGVPTAVNFTQAAGAALNDASQAAQNGTLGYLIGADIIVAYKAWPRAWQEAADWLRFRAEGGMTREVISHFLFFSERILGPLSVKWAHPSYPRESDLCETHLLARLETGQGQPVNIMASVGRAQPDRQELTIKGISKSRRISEFYIDAVSDGGDFLDVGKIPQDPRAASLRAQLDDLLLCINGQPHRLATLQEALRVQRLVEAMLLGRAH